jgi:hypothetical protein
MKEVYTMACLFDRKPVSLENRIKILEAENERLKVDRDHWRRMYEIVHDGLNDRIDSLKEAQEFENRLKMIIERYEKSLSN